MKYEKILETIAAILENDLIVKDGLTLVYELEEKEHKQLDEEMCIQMLGHLNGFEHQEVFEIELSSVIVKFIKKDLVESE